MQITLIVHRSLRHEGDPERIELTTSEHRSLLELVHEMTSPYPAIHGELFTPDGAVKNGILFISGDAELKSLGLLEQVVDEDVLIKIVPVLHGG